MCVVFQQSVVVPRNPLFEMLSPHAMVHATEGKRSADVHAIGLCTLHTVALDGERSLRS